MSVVHVFRFCARSRSGQAALKLVLNFRYVGDVNLRSYGLETARLVGHLVLHERGLRSIMRGRKALVSIPNREEFLLVV